jgi:protein MpaA
MVTGSSIHPQATSAAPVPRRSLIGHSVQGRPLFAFAVGPVDTRRRVLVVGCIHGDEGAGVRLSQLLVTSPSPATTQVVVVPNLNPDGVAARTRQNARRVDLNRNFPYRWQPIGRPGDQQYSGTGPLSEPESRAIATLIQRLRPTVTVWFHQPVGLVDESGGALAVERRFAALSGLPLRRMQRYPGSAASWQNTTWRGTSAFVVELPGWVSPSLQARVMKALRDLQR